MAKINHYNLEPFADKLRQIKPAMVLLNVYMQKRDNLNRIECKKDDIAAALGVARRTVTNWIIILARNGLIKYKYSGSARLNPFFSFDGSEDDFEQAKNEWYSFKSDIQEVS